MDELSPSSRRLVVVGTLLALFVASTNTTVVSTALPTIVGDLGGLNLLSWVFTAYMLTSTVTVPISGKLGDLYGRKLFVLAGIGIFTLASAVAGLSQSIEQLIVLRGIQGIGGGLIMSNAYAIIGDIFPPAERGKYQGMFSGVFGISSVLGPFIGGALTDQVSWRGVFYLNVPFAMAALALLTIVLPAMRRGERRYEIDYLGVAVLTGSIVSFLLALVWGGDEYAWTSPTIVGLVALAALLGAAFLLVEARAKEPVLPLHLFRNRVFAVASLLTLVSGTGMYGAITYMPMFVQGVLGFSATNSGLVTSPMMLGLVVSSTLAGFLASRTGRTKPFILGGGLVLVAGMFLLSRFSPDTTRLLASLGMIVVGAGIGFSMPIVNLVVQNAFSREYLGVATSSTQFFRQIGGTLGVAVFGTLVVTGLQSNLERNLPPDVQAQIPPALLQRLEEPQTLLNESAKVRLRSDFDSVGPEGPALYSTSIAATKQSLADALTVVFFLGFVVSAIAFALSFFLPERSLRSSWDEAPATARGEAQPTPVAVRLVVPQVDD